MLKAKRDKEISLLAHEAAMAILTDLEAKGEPVDPRETAQRISDAVGELLEKHQC